jgi:hypothetical protein
MSFPFAWLTLQPAALGLAMIPYPGAAFAASGCMLNVTRRIFGAYGSSTMVSPPPVSSRRDALGAWARENVPISKKPATKAGITKYLFIHTPSNTQIMKWLRK